jgi:hypothetical protein
MIPSGATVVHVTVDPAGWAVVPTDIGIVADVKERRGLLAAIDAVATKATLDRIRTSAWRRSRLSRRRALPRPRRPRAMDRHPMSRERVSAELIRCWTKRDHRSQLSQYGAGLVNVAEPVAPDPAASHIGRPPARPVGRRRRHRRSSRSRIVGW